MIAVVTGSTGFIGSHLVESLLAEGAEVRVIARPTTVLPRHSDRRVTAFRLDLSNSDVLRGSAVWDGATHCFHLAGVTKAHAARAFDDGNVVPLQRLLAALADRAEPRPHLVLMSSQAAGGPAARADAPVRESDAPHPIEEYGRSKLRAELAAAAYDGRLPISIVRPCAVYGPRDRDFLEVFRHATGRIAWYALPRNHQFSLLHVADVVRGLLLAARRHDADLRMYYLAAEAPVHWRTLYRAIARLSGTQPLEVEIPLPIVRTAAVIADFVGGVTGRATLLNRHKVELGSAPLWLCDASRARQELGWRPEVVLESGIEATYSWYVKAGWLRRSGAAATSRSEMEPRS